MIKELKMNSIEEIYGDMIPIGEGSYGVVFKAINKRLNKIVAVKVYKAELD